MTNYETFTNRFWKDGFLVLDNFFDDGLMGCIGQNIEQHFGADPEFWHENEFISRSQTEVIPWFPQNIDLPEHSTVAAEPFDQLEASKRLDQLTHALLGGGWQRDYCMVMFSKRGSAGQAWHQDCSPENPEAFNLNRLVYTSDITDEIGGQTVVVPGSHRMGILPYGDPAGEFDNQVVLYPKKGTLVLLHGHTWHRVLPVTGKYRFSTNYRAKSPQASDHITDICVYRNMRYRFSDSTVVEERTTD